MGMPLYMSIQYRAASTQGQRLKSALQPISTYGDAIFSILLLVAWAEVHTY